MTARDTHAGRDVTVVLESFLQDLRYASRKLSNNLGFALLAVLTLALGIGATTAVFSVINGVLLQPLPYPESDKIVAIAERAKRGGEMSVADPNFVDLRNQADSFDGLAAYGVAPTTVVGADVPVRVQVASVSADFFPIFRTRPVRGRLFTPDEVRAGGAPTAVVSYEFWRDHLGSTTHLTDNSLKIDGTSYRVIGVMPRAFRFPDASDVWTPRSLGHPATRSGHNNEVVGRLRPAVAIKTAQADLNVIFSRLKSQYGSEIDATGFNVKSLHDELVGSVERPLLLTLVAAALVLLVACTNVASTLLAAGTARGGEIAIRSALGARRTRLLRQLSTEGLLLAMLGAIAGVLLAAILLKLLLALAPADALPRLGDVALDWRVIIFALLAGVFAAVVSSLFPAFRLSRTNAGSQLVTRGEVGGRTRIWSVLVATEVALALLLLVGSGLIARSLWNVLRTDPGFRSNNVLTVDIALPDARYPNDSTIEAFYQQVIPELQFLRGVQEAGVTTRLPVSGSGLDGALDIEGNGPHSGYADYAVASGGFFRALGIPVQRGRLFDDRDRANTGDVAVVNHAFAQQYWPGQDAIGKRMRNLTNDVARFEGDRWVPAYGPDRWVTVVGVVGDVRNKSMTQSAAPIVYVNPLQRPFRARYAVLLLRGSVPPTTLIPPVRARLRQLGIPAEFQTMNARVSSSVAGRRFSASVLGLFALVALVLAAVGIYGVVSYQVVQRTREMGIRMALGAQPAQVRNLVMRNSMRVVALGLAAGVLATPLLTRVFQNLLFGVSAADPATFVGVLLLFSTVAVLACLIPARRATRVDPVIALRPE